MLPLPNLCLLFYNFFKKLDSQLYIEIRGYPGPPPYPARHCLWPTISVVRKPTQFNPTLPATPTLVFQYATHCLCSSFRIHNNKSSNSGNLKGSGCHKGEHRWLRGSEGSTQRRLPVRFGARFSATANLKKFATSCSLLAVECLAKMICRSWLCRAYKVRNKF